MNIISYIPFTPASRRRKFLNDLKTRRHSDDDVLSAAEKQLFDADKIRHLVSAADHFMTQLDDDCEFRFDIISVVVSPSGNVIEHYEDAFLPPLL